MKRGALILLVLFASCQPTFQSGKTLCSDKQECPSGFVCGNDGTNNVCFDNKIADCQSGYFYCAGSGTCTTSLTTCSTTGGLGGSGGSTCPASKLPEAGGTCNVLPACGCPAGQVCYPDTQATGLKCFTSSGLGLGADCSGDGDFCAAGLGCFGSVCKKYCQSDSDCPTVDSAQSCDSTTWDGTTTIPGVSVCSRVCDPVKPQTPRSPLLACPVGFGCSSMDSYPGASDCEPQLGNGVSGSTCSTDKDCSPGFYCSVGNACIKYCYTVADCPAGMTCVSFSTPNYAGTTQVNHCH